MICALANTTLGFATRPWQTPPWGLPPVPGKRRPGVCHPSLANAAQVFALPCPTHSGINAPHFSRHQMAKRLLPVLVAAAALAYAAMTTDPAPQHIDMDPETIVVLMMRV